MHEWSFKTQPQMPVDSASPNNAERAGEAPATSEIHLQIPPTPERERKSEHCRPDQTPWWKHIMELAAILVGVAVAIIYYKQLDTMQKQLAEMGASGQQTAQLIEAARLQAGASRRYVLAARNQARESSHIADSAIEQSDATTAMAKQTKRTADTANLALRLQTRPWMGFERMEVAGDITKGNEVSIVLYSKNWGFSPALHETNEFLMSTFCNGAPKHPNYTMSTLPPEMAVMPNQIIPSETLKFPISERDWELANRPNCELTILGRLAYSDLGGQHHWRHFCARWNKLTKREFLACNVYSDGDEDYKDGKEP